MKRLYLDLMPLLAYCVCYNIIRHGTEAGFMVGLAIVVISEMCMHISFKNGFRIYPETEGNEDET